MTTKIAPKVKFQLSLWALRFAYRWTIQTISLLLRLHMTVDERLCGVGKHKTRDVSKVIMPITNNRFLLRHTLCIETLFFILLMLSESEWSRFEMSATIQKCECIFKIFKKFIYARKHCKWRGKSKLK